MFLIQVSMDGMDTGRHQGSKYGKKWKFKFKRLEFILISLR